jgi:CubicO group peptidase (beta-lactamase class C family)
VNKIFITLLSLLFAQVASASDYSMIDDYVSNNKKLIQLPSGTAIAIIKDQKIVYEGYFGYSDIENKKKVHSDTVFYIASMTKPFYSLYMLLKEEQGKVDTQWPLAKLLAEIEFKPALQANKVTVQDLLSHTSGVDSWPLIQATAYTGQYDDNVLAKILEHSYVNENAPLGEYRYTNVGYNILSYWSDKNLNTLWQLGLNESIFKPLDMSHTSARMSDIDKNDWDYAHGYSVKSVDPEQRVYLQKTDKTMHAAGGMISTAKDLARFLITQVNQGKLDGEQVLPNHVIGKSQQKLIDYKDRGRQRAYGWGWQIRTLFDEKLLEHRGGFFGASTYMSFMPDKKIGVVVLSNQDKWGGDLAYAIESMGYAIALDKPNEEITGLYERNEAFVKKNTSKFFATKKGKSPEVNATISSDYLGTFIHDTLGTITVEKSNVTGHTISWGAMSSRLYKGDSPNQITAMFTPNYHESIVFMSSSDNKQYLKYRDYTFLKK